MFSSPSQNYQNVQSPLTFDGSFPQYQQQDSNRFGNEKKPQTSEDQSQKAPAFLFGNGKRRSLAVPPTANAPYLNSPSSGPTAPSSDIFASPLPSHLKDGPGGSGKSVHWSPALVQQERSMSNGSPVPPSHLRSITSHNAPSFSSPGKPQGPPLRSLRDDMEPVRKAVRRSVTSSSPIENPASTSIVVDNRMEAPEENTWVTVFGFSPADASQVLKFFTRHGEVVSHQIPTRGNWMHIRYSCGIHARQALSRNATILDGNVRIGVVPCTEKELVGSSDQSRHNLLNKSSLADQSIMELEEEETRMPSVTTNENVNMESSLNSSRISMSGRNGMRSMNAAYDHRQNNAAEPGKQETFMNKLWTAVGF